MAGLASGVMRARLLPGQYVALPSPVPRRRGSSCSYHCTSCRRASLLLGVRPRFQPRKGSDRLLKDELIGFDYHAPQLSTARITLFVIATAEDSQSHDESGRDRLFAAENPPATSCNSGKGSRGDSPPRRWQRWPVPPASRCSASRHFITRKEEFGGNRAACDHHSGDSSQPRKCLYATGRDKFI